jgi:phosphohistidine phosphatase
MASSENPDGKEVSGMAIFLVQHGRSMPKDINPDQSLTDEGISDARRIAGVAKGYGISVAEIKHSGKSSARQTAEVMAEYLMPGKNPEGIDGLNPTDDVIPFARSLSPEQDLMVVGHLPFMERLVSYLITGSIEIPVFKFQNAGIVCMDKDPVLKAWYIKWTLMPEIS